MKRLVVKSCLMLALVVLVADSADAQRTGRRRGGGTTPPAGQTTNPGETGQTNNTQPSGYNPYGNIPIVVDSTSVTDTSVKKTLRQDDAFGPRALTQRTPLDYEFLRYDDALFAEKVWRELDLREKMNQTFSYNEDNDNGSQIFINMLLRAVNTGQVTAFADERFTTPMTIPELQQLTTGTADTVPQTDVNDPNKIVRYVVTRSSFDPKSVIKLRLKEEWIFDREASRLFCRIIGIAPLKTQYHQNGKEKGSSVMFWVYYPDLRPMLAKAEVYNPKNMGQSRMTWEELFETRMFSSYIIKSTYDNASNKAIKAYIKDPILALLEGDNIKDKIFNYEQDLWSY
jgi:gliding motility associated protien GldN